MNPAPTVVIFGASGDLTSRKLIPALYDNFRKQRLPRGLRIVGVSRTPMTDDAFRDRLYEKARATLGDICERHVWDEFAKTVYYQPGDVGVPADHSKLDERLNAWEQTRSSGRLYYLALAPQLYAQVVEHLGQAGMAHEERGWRRIVLEKPFGQDLASARELNRQVGAVFQESQVYRIDHYLGKETVQNLLALRFANTIFEPLWNRNYIEHIQITVAEEVRVGTRGAHYDSVGVLRDMFQNHLSQILTLIAMEPPTRFEATALRDEKVKVLDAIHVPDAETVETCSVLGQYAGYHNEPGVSPDSRMPTYAAVRLNVDNWRWQGIPFYLRSGKGLTAKTSEVIIQFLCPPHMIFDIPKGETIRGNRLVVTLQPDEGIHVAFQTKIPDEGMILKESNLYFHYRDSYPVTAIPDAYETLLLDVMEGDASLFIRDDEIELAWRVIDPIIAGWEARTAEPLPEYAVGSWGPARADVFMRNEGREWVNGASLHHDP